MSKTEIFSLLPLKEENKLVFMTDMQESFQKGAEDEFGKSDEIVLPQTHIESSLKSKGAFAYQAMLGDEIVGGAVVVINEKSQHNHLDFLYVKNGYQGKGIGKKIWDRLEELYPDTKVWETVTPYFDKRNIHFYINKCGFHAVEFFSELHKDPNMPAEHCDISGISGCDCMFRFEKNYNLCYFTRTK